MDVPGAEAAPQPAALPVVGAVVVTHGQLATELVNAAEAIVGDLPHVAAVSIGWHDESTAARGEIEAAIARVAQPGGVVLLTDMFGGTPSNLAITFVEPGRVEVVTGVNLPMLIRLAGLREATDLRSVARRLRDDGQGAIWVASDLLQGQEREA